MRITHTKNIYLEKISLFYKNVYDNNSKLGMCLIISS